jgi:CRISPR-associated protein Csb2
VLYWRKSDALQVSVPTQEKDSGNTQVTMMLLSLTTPSGNRGSLPPCTRTLPQAELFHRALIGRLGKGHEVYCPELTGRDVQGMLLRGQHQHAYTLPLDLDSDGHLDHILVFAKMKLGETAQRAIRQVKRLWAKGVSVDIQAAVVGIGDLDILRSLPSSIQGSISSLLGPPEGSLVWESVTPFVPPRYLKRDGKNSLSGQVKAELISHGHPDAESIEIQEELSKKLRHYIRRRTHGAALQPPTDMGYGLRIVFSKPVSGPILLGYASHYGLGLFAPAD